MRRALSILSLSTLTLAPAQQFIDAPCFENDLGSPVGPIASYVVQNLNLGFAFPIPGYGSAYMVELSTNGFLWFGHNVDPACCNGNATQFLGGIPRIAALWMELVPGSTSNIWYNAIPARNGHPARFVATWLNVLEAGRTQPFTLQIQVLETGAFVLWYDERVRVDAHTALVGCSAGQGAPGMPVDFAAITRGAPFDSGTTPSLYRQFPSSFSLAGRRLEFAPNGRGGYLVQDRTICREGNLAPFGHGCPQPTTVYETFASGNTIDLSGRTLRFTPDGAGGYTVTAAAAAFHTALTNNLQLGDEQVARNLALPFPFPHAGGTTTAIDVSSNGSIYLVPGTIADARCCHGDSEVFRNGTAAIAVLWQDLAPQLAPFGGVWFDIDPSGHACHATWANCPEAGQPGTACSAQVSLFDDGAFELRYQTVVNRGHQCLVGYTAGGGGRDPGGRDLTASLPFATGPGGVPLVLRGTGQLPMIGAGFEQELAGIPGGTALAVVMLGRQGFPVGVDLAPSGFPGCRQWASADSVHESFLAPNGPVRFSIAVPDNTGLVGVTLFEQGAALVPGSPRLLVSNGMMLTIGG